jgi:hypothetical protein
LYRFLAIAVLLDVKDIPQVGPLQWGWINLWFGFAPKFRPGLQPNAEINSIFAVFTERFEVG